MLIVLALITSKVQRRAASVTVVYVYFQVFYNDHNFELDEGPGALGVQNIPISLNKWDGRTNLFTFDLA